MFVLGLIIGALLGITTMCIVMINREEEDDEK